MLFSRLFRCNRQADNPARPKVRRPLRLEQLEDRAVPAVSLLSHYDGLSFDQSNGGYVPPDTCGAAGPVNYVETVNQTVRVSNKTTGAAVATDSFSHFWFTTGGLPRADSGSSLSDPIVVWDDQVQRFIIGDQDINFSTHQSRFDIAVSKTDTPGSLGTANWYFFQVNTTESGYNADFPGNFGYNRDAFVFTLNMLGASSHVQVDSLKVSDLVNGTLTAYKNDVSASLGTGLRPAVMHDSVAGDPMWLVNTNTSTSIRVVKMTNVLSTSATFTNTTLTVNSYSNVVAPKQPDGTAVTTNIGSGIMKVAEWGGQLVATHAIGKSSTQDAARWYLVNVAGSTPTLLDQGDVTSTTTGAGTNNVYDYFPGIDINAYGDIGMSFMQSGTAAGQFMSVYVTGRTSDDPAGTMETPVLVQAGAKNYLDFANPHRAGDLSGISVDSDSSFWAANEYATNRAGSPPNNWGTTIGHFSLRPPQPVDPGFETPNVGTGTFGAFQYNPSGSPWTFNPGSGVAGNGSGFTAGNPNAPQGTQVAFLQGAGASISQSVTLAAGAYNISFSAAQRGNGNASSQIFQVLIDNTVVGTFTPGSTSYAVFSTSGIAVTAGAHTIQFLSLDPDNLDNTAFIDLVRINQVQAVSIINDPGFETPNVGTGTYGAFQYNPSGSPWTFGSGSGVAGNGSGFTAGNPNAPQGTQVAFLQAFGTISQTATFAAGTYSLSFNAAQRGNGNFSYQTFQVLIDGNVVGTINPTDTNYSVYTTNSFTVTAGPHTITFVGTDPDGQDNTAFIDQVQVFQFQ
jgi:hypothetical protein